MTLGQVRSASDSADEARVKRRAIHSWRAASGGKPVTLIKDAERTQAEIIEVATQEFSTNGYSGGRVNEIAARTRTSKRMIYYYFGSKEGLYRAVLKAHYQALRTQEQALRLDREPPVRAMRLLIQFTFDYHLDHADRIPLVMSENISRGVFINQPSIVEPLNGVALVDRIYARGVEEGAFRAGLRAVDIYMSIASASFFNVSNRYTFAAIFNHDMTEPAEVERRRAAIGEMILRYVAADPANIDAGPA